MATVALAITGGGALSPLETTVLLTVDETMDALRKAQEIGYRPPGAYRLARRARIRPSPSRSVWAADGESDSPHFLVCPFRTSGNAELW
jgi:hypothetical protein